MNNLLLVHIISQGNGCHLSLSLHSQSDVSFEFIHASCLNELISRNPQCNQAEGHGLIKCSGRRCMNHRHSERNEQLSPGSKHMFANLILVLPKTERQF